MARARSEVTARPDVVFTYRVSPLKEAALVGAAIAAVVSGLFLGARFIRRSCPPCDPAALNRLDRRALKWHYRVLGPLSYLMDFSAIIMPALVAARDRGLTRELAEDVSVYAEAFAATAVLNVAVKTMVGRPIPLLYSAGLYPELETSASGYRSFYSGHTAHMTMALTANAVMSALRGKRRTWLWILIPMGTAAMAAA